MWLCLDDPKPPADADLMNALRVELEVGDDSPVYEVYSSCAGLWIKFDRTELQAVREDGGKRRVELMRGKFDKAVVDPRVHERGARQGRNGRYGAPTGVACCLQCPPVALSPGAVRPDRSPASETKGSSPVHRVDPRSGFSRTGDLSLPACSGIACRFGLTGKG